jgi:hypothetical protein
MGSSEFVNYEIYNEEYDNSPNNKNTGEPISKEF